MPLSAGFEASRKTPEAEKTLDSLTGSIGFSLGPVRAVLDTTITGLVETPAGPYPGIGSSFGFETLKATCELGYSPGPFRFRTKLGFTRTEGKEPVWDTSFSAAISGKAGRFSVKIASPNFPQTWTGVLSWRLEKKGLFKKSD
jgi:hypothetical protein